MDKYAFIGCTLLLTVFGQLTIKARSLVHAVPGGQVARMRYLTLMISDFWVWMGLLAAALAAACWMLALQRAALTQAYPFMALTYALVPLGAFVLFGEAIRWMYLLGLVLITLGLLVTSAAS